MADSLAQLVASAKEAGLTGDELSNFLREERAAQRDAVKMEKERVEKEKERQHQLAEREKERQHQLAEKEHAAAEREKERQHELALAEAKAKTPINPAKSSKLSFKMPPFDDAKDDLDAYISRFEQYSTVHGYAKDTWACNLSVQLRGNALAVFHRMALADQQDYDKLKGTLLRAYQMTEAGYRDKFRESKPLDDEEFTQYVTRLSNYLDRWLELGKTEKTFDALRDLIVRDQVLQVCYQGLKGFIQERKPKDLQEFKDLGVTYLDANGRSSLQWASGTRETQRQTKGQSVKTQQSGQANQKVTETKSETPRETGKSERQCWLCNSTTHIARDCHKRQGKSQSGTKTAAASCKDLQTVYADPDSNVSIYQDDEGNIYSIRGPSSVENLGFAAVDPDGLPIQVGRVKGCKDDVKVLRDTGCTTTVVRRSLCDLSDFSGEKQACLLMDGTLIVKPLVVTHIDTPFYTGQVKAIAMEHPVCDVVIGNIPGARNPDDPDPDWKPGRCEVAKVTRSQDDGKQSPMDVAASAGMLGAEHDQVKPQKIIPSLQELRCANAGKTVGRVQRSHDTKTDNRRFEEKVKSDSGMKTLITGKQVVSPEHQTPFTGELRHGSKSLTREVRDQVKGEVRYHHHKQRTKINPGDKVLVLTPTESKTIMQWKGPFQVIRQVRGNCFVVNFYGKERIYHVSMLEKCLDGATVGTSVVRLGWSASLSRGENFI